MQVYVQQESDHGAHIKRRVIAILARRIVAGGW
jgi:hypothetical protein